MKHRILLMGFGFLWACSGDPKQGTQDRGPSQANVQESNAATSGTTSSSNAEGVTTTTSNDSPSAVAETPSPATPAIPAPNENTAASPPHQVTGAYLVGSLLPSDGGSVIRVGLIAKKDDKRLSEQSDVYLTNWSMDVPEGSEADVKLLKSNAADYDQVLEYYGTQEEFAVMQSKISLKIKVSVVGSEYSLNEVVQKNLLDLLSN